MSDQNERPGPSNTQRHSTAVPISVPMKAVPRVITDFLNAYKPPEKELTPDSGAKQTRDDSNTSEDLTKAKIIYNAAPPRRGGITIVGKMHNFNLAPTYQKFLENATVQNKTSSERWSSSEKKRVHIPSVLAQSHGASRKETIVEPKRRLICLRENRSFPPIFEKVSSYESGTLGPQSSITPIHASGEQLQQSANLEIRVGSISTDAKVYHDKSAFTYQNSQEGGMAQKITAHAGWSSSAKKHEHIPSGSAQGLDTSSRITIVVPKNRISLHRGNRSFPPIVDKISSAIAGPSGLQSSITPMHTSEEQLYHSVNLDARESAYQKSLYKDVHQIKQAQEGRYSSMEKYEPISPPSVYAHYHGASSQPSLEYPARGSSILPEKKPYTPIVEQISPPETGPSELQFSVNPTYSSKEQLFQLADLDTYKANIYSDGTFHEYCPTTTYQHSLESGMDQIKQAQEGRSSSMEKYEPISPPSVYAHYHGALSQPSLEYPARGSSILPEKKPYTPIVEPISPPETGPSELQFSVNPTYSSKEQLFQLADLDTYKANIYSDGTFHEYCPTTTYQHSLESGMDQIKQAQEGRSSSMEKYEPISPPSVYAHYHGALSQPSLEYPARGSSILPEKKPYTPIVEQISPPETGPSELQFSVNPTYSSMEQLFQLADLDTYKANIYSDGTFHEYCPTTTYQHSLESGMDQIKQAQEGRSSSMEKYEPISPPSVYAHYHGALSQPSLEYPARGSSILPEKKPYTPIVEPISPPETGPSELQFSVNPTYSSKEELFQLADLDTYKANIYSDGTFHEYCPTTTYQHSLESGMDQIKQAQEGRSSSMEKYEPISPPSVYAHYHGALSQPSLEYPARGSSILPEKKPYTPIVEQISPPETGPSELQFSVNPTYSSKEELFQLADLDTYKANIYSDGTFHEYCPTTTYQHSLESGMDQIKQAQEGRSSSMEKYEPISPPSVYPHYHGASSQPSLDYPAKGSNILPEKRSYTPIFDLVSSPKAGPSGLQFSKSPAYASHEQSYQADTFCSLLPHEDIHKEIVNYDEELFDLLSNQEDQNIGKDFLKSFQQSDGGVFIFDLDVPISDYYASLAVEETQPPTIQRSSTEMVNPLTVEETQPPTIQRSSADMVNLLTVEETQPLTIQLSSTEMVNPLTVEETQPPTIQCSSTEMVNPLTVFVKPSTSAVNSSSVSVLSNYGGSSLSAGTTRKQRRRKYVLPPGRGCLPGTYIQYRGFSTIDDNDVESGTPPTRHEFNQCLKKSAVTTDRNPDGKGVESIEEKLLASPSYDVPELDLFAQDGLSEAVSCVRNNPDDVSPKPKNANIDNPEYIRGSYGPRKRGRPRKYAQPPIPTKPTRGASLPTRRRTRENPESFRNTMRDLSHLLGHMRMPAWKQTLPCGTKAYLGRGFLPFKIPPASEVQKVALESAALGNKIRKSHPSKKEDVVQDIVGWLMDNEEEEKYQQKNPEE